MPVSSSSPERSESDLLKPLAMAAVGGLLLGAGAGRGRSGLLLRLGGLALIAQAARPVLGPLLSAAGARRQRLSTHTSLDVDRPVAEVFAFFKDFENFPRVADGIKCVVDHQDGRSHWEIYSAAGTIVTWDAVVTKYVPNVVIAWTSVPGSAVDMSGLIRFTPVSANRTHMEMDLTYTRVEGEQRIADALHSFIGPRPARRLETTLRRTRAYLEALPPSDSTGKVAASNVAASDDSAGATGESDEPNANSAASDRR